MLAQESLRTDSLGYAPGYGYSREASQCWY